MKKKPVSERIKQDDATAQTLILISLIAVIIIAIYSVFGD